MADDTTTTTEPAPDATTSWRDALPDDIKAEGVFTKYNSPADAHRAHVAANADLTRMRQELKSRPPAGAVLVPGEGATEDQTKAWREALGIPEKAEGYELHTKSAQDARHPERMPITINDADMKTFRDLCHANGVSPRQAQAILDFQLGRELRNANGVFEHNNQLMTDGNAALATKYGDDLPAKRALIGPMKQMMSGGDPAKLQAIEEMLATTSIGNNPVFLEAAITLMEHTGSGERLIPSTGPAPGATTEQARTQESGVGGGVIDYGHGSGTAKEKAGKPMQPQDRVKNGDRVPAPRRSRSVALPERQVQYRLPGRGLQEAAGEDPGPSRRVEDRRLLPPLQPEVRRLLQGAA